LSWTKPFVAIWKRTSTWSAKVRRRFFGALHRVHGATIPVIGGGLSWTPPPYEREELRKLVVFLEDRRALFNPYETEAEIFVEQSVQQIRTELTKVLQTIGEDARACQPLRTMRSACQRYLTKSDGFRDGPYRHRRPPRHFRGHIGDEDDDFILALGELRGVVGVCIDQIASSYSIEVHGELAGLLPLDETDQ
jgi:hypothetical protein